MATEGMHLQANAGYMIAAYAATGVILAGYALLLWRKARKAAGLRRPGSGDRP